MTTIGKPIDWDNVPETKDVEPFWSVTFMRRSPSRPIFSTKRVRAWTGATAEERARELLYNPTSPDWTVLTRNTLKLREDAK